MFYQKPVNQALRFGDVIHGFVLSVLKMSKPSLDHKHLDYQLDLRMPEFCVVFSPCCSISDSTITLVSLEQILPAFFTNPFFVQDFTNINRKMPPDKLFPPDIWDNKISEEEKAKRLGEGNVFTLGELFLYAPDEILPEYTLSYKKKDYKTGYYMINFKHSFRIDCPQIQSPEKSPLESKLLQLSVEARQELRDKVSWYYSRPPQEDLVLLRAK